LTEERARRIGQRSALLVKMRTIAKDVRGDDPTRRVHLIVSIDRFLQRLLATTGWGTWALKGGYANQLRHPDEARFTEDVDLKIDADIGRATEMIANAAALELDDPFSFEMAAPPRTLVGPPGGGLRYIMVARLIGQELVRFKVDVSSQDAVVGNLERHRSDPIVERLGLARATFPVYPIAQQFAEKIHAYTRPRDVENTRAKDLADMVWFTTRHAFRSQALIEAGLATFVRRGEHPWPPILATPPAVWARQYAFLRREMDLEQPTADDAYEALVAFLAPVLGGDRTLRWSPKTRTWSKVAAQGRSGATDRPRGSDSESGRA
jgi:predicted nucleotidyltransferase component of viral defense system